MSHPARPIYLDYNATTPVDSRVLEAMLPWFTEGFGNAASATHAYGWQAAEAVEKARESLAATLSCTPQELIFTSGATEAINLAMKGVAEAYASKGRHMVIAATEHKAVLDTAEWVRKRGGEITLLPVNEQGLVDPVTFEAAIRPDTVLAGVMYANNETGVLQPLRALADASHAKGCLFMSDVVQAVGKIPVHVDELGIDLAPVSAHKLYGPKGVGALYVRRKSPRVTLLPQIEGGGHERGLRSGTLNVPGIVGLGMAVQIANEAMAREQARLGSLREQLENGCLAMGGVCVNGGKAPRLAHVTNLAFEGFHARDVIRALPGLAVATGSACTSASPKPSHVLRAMGLPDSRIHGSLRFSLGRFTTEEDIHHALEAIRTGIRR